MRKRAASPFQSALSAISRENSNLTSNSGSSAYPKRRVALHPLSRICTYSSVASQLKPKRLAGATIRTPEQAAQHGGHAGYISDSKTTYNVWMTDRERSEEDMSRDARLPGEEMFGMEVLLPRKKKGGKLYQGALYFTLCVHSCN